MLLETFVDPTHFQGSCYRAAGWTLLGRTSGAGLVRPGKHYQTSPKLIFAKPLQANFRARLCSNQLKGRTELWAKPASGTRGNQSAGEKKNAGSNNCAANP